MIALIAKLNVAEGKGAGFEAAFAKLVDAVRADEPGNQLYHLCKAEDGSYTVMELYDDDAAIDAHRDSTHFKEIGASLGEFMAGRPDVQRLEVVK